MVLSRLSGVVDLVGGLIPLGPICCVGMSGISYIGHSYNFRYTVVAAEAVGGSIGASGYVVASGGIVRFFNWA